MNIQWKTYDKKTILPNLENPEVASKIATDIKEVKKYYRIVRIGPYKINDQSIGLECDNMSYNRYYLQEATLDWHKPWIFGRKIVKQSLKKSPDVLYKWKTLCFTDWKGRTCSLMNYSEICDKYRSCVLNFQTELLQRCCKEHMVLEYQND